MNLNTRKRMTCSKITLVPLTQLVKDRVENMAREQGITEVKFTNRNGMDLPKADWLAGVDYDADAFSSIEENEGGNSTYNEEDNIDDVELEVNKEVNETELDEILTGESMGSTNNKSDKNVVFNNKEIDTDSSVESTNDSIDQMIDEIENDFEEIRKEGKHY